MIAACTILHWRFNAQRSVAGRRRKRRTDEEHRVSFLGHNKISLSLGN